MGRGRPALTSPCSAASSPNPRTDHRAVAHRELHLPGLRRPAVPPVVTVATGGGTPSSRRDQDDIVYRPARRDPAPRLGRGVSSPRAATCRFADLPGQPRRRRPRPVAGQLRDRTYPGQVDHRQAIDDLAKVISGFDCDVDRPARGTGRPAPDLLPLPGRDPHRPRARLRVDGVGADPHRQLGRLRQLLCRVIGNNGSDRPAAAQVLRRGVEPDANDVDRRPGRAVDVADNAADVPIQSTLDEQAQGDLALSGVLIPYLHARPAARRLHAGATRTWATSSRWSSSPAGST